MRNKFEEELAQLAFGDLSDERASKLRAQAGPDPETARTYEMYCRMKDELKSLAVDVPSDQLSTERLRDAILQRGLTEKPVARTRPSWVWVPIAAGIFAFGIAFVKGMLPAVNPTTSVVVSSNAAIDNADVAIPELRIEKPTPDLTAPTLDRRAAVMTEKVPVRVAANETRGRRVRSADLPSRSEATEPTLPDAYTAVSFDRASTEQGMSLASNTYNFGGEAEKTDAVVAVASEPAPIIVIQADTDYTTGALRATEVENTANVVVGG